MKKTVVFIHGAFQGGWAWKQLIDQLPNYNCYAPTLSTPQGNGLNEHVEQVCNLIEQNELTHITLIGHSYGGMVITGVVHRVPGLIKKIIYLDAVIAEPDHSLLDILGSDAQQFFNSLTFEQNGELLVQTFPAQAFGFDSPEHVDNYFHNHVPQALKTFTDKLAMKSPDQLSHIQKTYIRCILANPFSATQAEKAQKRGWACYEIIAGHCPMLTNTQELATLLQSIL